MISYLIANNKGAYIRYDEGSKKYVPVKNKNFATSWESRAKATNILKNSIPKSIRSSYRIIEDGDFFDANPAQSAKESNAAKIEPKVEQEPSELHIDDVKRIANSEIIEHNFDDWVNGIGQIEGFFVSAAERKETLLFEMSNIDKEISDVEHYIEFKNLNAYQGWMACKMLQNRLRQRRKIKDELTVISQIAGCSISKDEIREVQDVAAHITEERRYEPRVLTELFA